MEQQIQSDDVLNRISSFSKPIVESLFFLCFGESLSHLLPVDDLPHFLQEGWPQVFVVQVVGVLPDVYCEQGFVSRIQISWSILVLCLSVFQNLGILVVHKPSPA